MDGDEVSKDDLDFHERVVADMFSGEYDDLTVAEFAARYAWGHPVGSDQPAGWRMVDVPVTDGVATLPDGSVVTVGGSATVVRIPVVTGSEFDR